MSGLLELIFSRIVTGGWTPTTLENAMDVPRLARGASLHSLFSITRRQHRIATMKSSITKCR